MVVREQDRCEPHQNVLIIEVTDIQKNQKLNVKQKLRFEDSIEAMHVVFLKRVLVCQLKEDEVTKI